MKWLILILSIGSSLSYSKEYTEEENFECLALNVYYEARQSSLLDQTGILLVVNNRIKSNKFPNTPCGVVWQSKQFSWTHDGKKDTPYELEAFDIIKLVVASLWKKIDEIPDITFGATYYHADWMTPCWLPDMKFLNQIDEHRYYKPVKTTGACYKRLKNNLKGEKYDI